MTPRELIDAFEVLAEAPDGVKRLRELVLQLAVRGKLVPQDPGDEPVGFSRGALADSGNGKGPDDGPPFGLPSRWAWLRLADCCSFVNRGKSPIYADSSSVPVVSQKCVQWSGFDLSRARFIEPVSITRYGREQLLRQGDLLWNSTGHGTLGRIIEFTPDARYPNVVADSHVTIVRPRLCVPRFLWTWLAGPVVQADVEGLATGSTKQTELATSAIRAMWVPVPPLAEQHRIVARVDELMGLLDRLEAARKDRDATRDAARDSALAALRNADTPDEVEVAWNRIAERMPALFTRPTDLEPLRQAVLQLAVRGRLVRQDPNDEPASVLLERIAANNARIRRAERLPAAMVDDEPVHVPRNWVWCRVGDISVSLAYGTSTKSSPSGVLPVLRMGNLQRGVIDWTDLKYTSDPEDIAKYALPAGSVLFNRTNSPELVGKTAIYRGERPAAFAGYLIHIAQSEGVEPEFLNIVLNSPMARAWCWSVRTDGISQSNISASKLAMLALPLPPTAEQHRIVAKVDALMALIDQLEAHLTAAESLHTQFAAAAVHHLDA